MAVFAPTQDSTVRRIRSSRDCVRTMMVTSSGMRLSSTSLRTKSKSVCEADGKPTSISLKPIFTSWSNMRSLRSTFMGSINDWLPSRKSVLIQMGGWVMRLLGQVRSEKSRSKATNGRYFSAGFGIMVHLICIWELTLFAAARTITGGRYKGGRMEAAELPRDARPGNRSVVEEARGEEETCRLPLGCPPHTATPRPAGRRAYRKKLRTKNP